MQDGPAYLLIKILTIDELHERGTYPIDWLLYSPDRNPIERFWD
jgi:hypothetical protein